MARDAVYRQWRHGFGSCHGQGAQQDTLFELLAFDTPDYVVVRYQWRRKVAADELGLSAGHQTCRAGFERWHEQSVRCG